MSKKILQINFKIKVPRSDYEKATLDQFARPIASVKGLLWKVWLVNDDKKEAGGVYLFKDEQSLNAFLRGNIVADVKKHPALSDIDAKIFDVMDEHSKLTYGPID